MAYTAINKSTDQFNVKAYSGNSSTQSITGVGFQPDWVWIKKRDGSDDHVLYDVVRGATKNIHSNTTDNEDTQTDGLTSFDSDGFSLGADGKSNQGHTYVSWNWKAANSQGSSNTDGSINTTYTSANTTSGFSICKWTGTGSNATIGHGLGVAPSVVMCKRLSGGAQNWYVFHKRMWDEDNTGYINLNGSDGKSQAASVFQSTAPTSTVFSTGTSFVSSPYIAYCFAEKAGFFNSGIYKGNGNANGAFIYTGFKPAFVIYKRFGANGDNWMMKTSELNSVSNGNQNNYYIKADENGAETTGSTATGIDFLSNGFKLRNTDTSGNTTSDYIYMAWAEAPLVGSNNIPATAR